MKEQGYAETPIKHKKKMNSKVHEPILIAEEGNKTRNNLNDSSISQNLSKPDCSSAPKAEVLATTVKRSKSINKSVLIMDSIAIDGVWESESPAR